MPVRGSRLPQEFKTEAVKLTEAIYLQVKDEDATDSANITTQAYVEKYSASITPTAWMKSYGKRATLIVEYIIKTDPGAGTVSMQTLVGGADAVEKTGLTIASGKQTAVHTDITDFTSDLTVSLEAKNSDAGQTSVIDYCNVYLQIGTASITSLQVASITGIKSLSFNVSQLQAKVWSGAVDSMMIYLRDSNLKGLLLESGITISKQKYDLGVEVMLGVLDENLDIRLETNNVENPAILQSLTYTRAWFE